MSTLTSKFLGFSSQLEIVNPDPKDRRIIAGQTIVHAPWALYTKSQEAFIVGVTTSSMINAVNSKGESVYRFINAFGGWEPEASVGDILMQDIANLLDVWAVKPDIFGQSSGWNGRVRENFSVTYSKPGKAQWAIEIPRGTVVVSREGPIVSKAGSMLAVTGDGSLGDFYVWGPEVVKTKVRPYVSAT